MLAEAAGPDQHAAKKMRPGHCTKKFHPGDPGVTFLGTDTSFAQSHPPLLEKYLIEGTNFSQIQKNTLLLERDKHIYSVKD